MAFSLPAPSRGDAERESDPWFRAGREAAARARARAPPGPRARNVILFLGDGMGVSTVTAARILEGQLRGEPGEENSLAFETLPYVALTKTYNTNRQVPDSAGAMTAIVSGVKTKAGVLGLSDRASLGDHRSVGPSRVPTLLEEAEDRGLATGIVTTTSLTHATPAACYAHAPQRSWEDDSLLSHEARKEGFPDIALQFLGFAHGDGIDVALGGGRAHFLPANGRDPEEPGATGSRLDERNLPAEWVQRFPNGSYVWNREQFEALDPQDTERLLGLFDPLDMEFEIDRASDRGGEPSLSEMTAKAIRILSRNPKGFLLVVEGGRIDHGHHLGNAYRALTETIEFSNAVRTALALTRPEETLIVVTADHGHPLTLSGQATRGNPILGKVVENDPQGVRAGLARDASGLPYTTLGYPVGPGHLAATDAQPEGIKHYPHDLLRSQGSIERRPDLGDVDTEAARFLQEAAVPRFSTPHGGEDVAVYAGGPGAALFHGVQEQHFIYHAVVEALGWREVTAPSP